MGFILSASFDCAIEIHISLDNETLPIVCPVKICPLVCSEDQIDFSREKWVLRHDGKSLATGRVRYVAKP